jgi:hypothetical protein
LLVLVAVFSFQSRAAFAGKKQPVLLGLMGEGGVASDNPQMFGGQLAALVPVSGDGFWVGFALDYQYFRGQDYCLPFYDESDYKTYSLALDMEARYMPLKNSVAPYVALGGGLGSGYMKIDPRYYFGDYAEPVSTYAAYLRLGSLIKLGHTAYLDIGAKAQAEAVYFSTDNLETLLGDDYRSEIDDSRFAMATGSVSVYIGVWNGF